MGKLEKELADARSTNLESMIAFYSTHKNSLVRMAVLENPNITEDVLKDLTNDTNFVISQQAENKLNSIKETTKSKQAAKNIEQFITCSNCLEPSRLGDNFCRNCGNEVKITNPYCNSCAVEREADSVYCRMCGTRLLTFKLS